MGCGARRLSRPLQKRMPYRSRPAPSPDPDSAQVHRSRNDPARSMVTGILVHGIQRGFRCSEVRT